MALEKLVLDDGQAWALWRIDEDEQTLHDLVHTDEELPPSISNPRKRLEWLAARALVQKVMEALGMTFQGIVKDDYGKPFPRGYDYQLSLSHSFPYVAVRMDAAVPTGIDVEQPKEKLLRIGPRVLHTGELADAGADVIKHCIYWCAKETLVKVYGKKDLVFAENLLIEPFSREKEGDITGRIIVGNTERVIPLYYIVLQNMVVVFNKRM